jgi:hypothetical protein
MTEDAAQRSRWTSNELNRSFVATGYFKMIFSKELNYRINQVRCS